MIEGVMLLWFVLTGLSVVFVVIDIPKTPESVVIKWAFVILTVFTGPLGAFFYVLGCREPLKGQHEQYVSATWRQVLGSTMHRAAGDGLGIIAGAAIGAQLHLSPAAIWRSNTPSASASAGPISRPSPCATWRAVLISVR